MILSVFTKTCLYLRKLLFKTWNFLPKVSFFLALVGLLILSPSVGAEPSKEMLFSPKTHIALGPTMSAVHQESIWDSKISADLFIGKIRQSKRIAIVGASLGIASYARTEGFLLQSEFYLGTRLLNGIPMGISIGPTLRLPANRPDFTVRSSIWFYHGIMPFLGYTWQTSSAVIEIGIRVPFSFLSF